MEKEKYITDAEYRKCKKIASVFSMLEEDDIVLLDVGRYGFVALFYYTPPRGFDTVQSFTDSQEMFDCLWDAWLESQLYRYAETMTRSPAGIRAFWYSSVSQSIQSSLYPNTRLS